MWVRFSIDLNRAFDFARIDVYNTCDIFIHIFYILCMRVCVRRVVSKRKG